ncbi:MAG: ABC transporter permease [Xanthobacteraceae bacterium]|jgi:ribose/xylose/arabinose/galactoside ABC-type transport system permease subunit
MRSILRTPAARPYILLVATIAIFYVVDLGHGRINQATVFSVLQLFATLGPVALGLGMTMIAREFDLSIVGMMSLAGCIAVMTGGTYPLLGLALAVAAGCFSGVLQGAVMTWLDISSVGVTLGGLLTSGGLAYVLTNNSSIAYPRMDVAMMVNAPIGSVLSIRNIVAIMLFVTAAFVFHWTRIGRDVVATGSNRRAALVAGVGVRSVVMGVFALSGMLAALSGALLSYSLAAASPVALVDALVPATAAAIIGGVSLSGGKGTPASIAGGVLVLCVLRSGLTAIGVPPLVHDLVTGGVLLTVALLDASALEERLFAFRRWRLGRSL